MTWSLALTATAAGCAHTVQVELPPAPAVALQTEVVSVVAVDRTCRDVANALVEHLAITPGITVDPQAPVQLHVYACEAWLGVPEVDLRQEVDEGGNTRESREVSLDGRSHAVVDVVAKDQVAAHLIGVGRHQVVANAAGGETLPVRRRVERALIEAVALDLTEQVRPAPRIASRRVYPNAAADSHQGLMTQAVRAELDGDVARAHELALLAHETQPTSRSEAYIAELQRLVHLDNPVESAYDRR